MEEEAMVIGWSRKRDDGQGGRRGGRRGNIPRVQSGTFVLRGRVLPPPIRGRDAGKGGGRGGPLLPGPGRGGGRDRGRGSGLDRGRGGREGRGTPLKFGKVGLDPGVLVAHRGFDEDDVSLIRCRIIRITQVDAPMGGDIAEGQVGGDGEDELMQHDMLEA
ncbi:uncharacterized protein LOC131060416 [Cryptomeria japonica]|uniref:uncharacterized protein LOC131060416 n=1 Tax=Cryptomeria japonica TaxID=3369 RepID=UPI0027DA7A50|nr:uncharacterized protein LOC131060416 [Cryptomeria japonica]